MPPLPVPASLQKSIDDTKVEYVQLGTSGLRVSSPILGTMGIGSKQWLEWVIEEEEGLQVLKMAWDRGTPQPAKLFIFSEERGELMIEDRAYYLGHGECILIRSQ